MLLRTIGPEIIPQARETCSAAGKKCPQINGESPEWCFILLALV